MQSCHIVGVSAAVSTPLRSFRWVPATPEHPAATKQLTILDLSMSASRVAYLTQFCQAAHGSGQKPNCPKGEAPKYDRLPILYVPQASDGVHLCVQTGIGCPLAFGGGSIRGSMRTLQRLLVNLWADLTGRSGGLLLHRWDGDPHRLVI